MITVLKEIKKELFSDPSSQPVMVTTRRLLQFSWQERQAVYNHNRMLSTSSIDSKAQFSEKIIFLTTITNLYVAHHKQDERLINCVMESMNIFNLQLRSGIFTKTDMFPMLFAVKKCLQLVTQIATQNFSCFLFDFIQRFCMSAVSLMIDHICEELIGHQSAKGLFKAILSQGHSEKRGMNFGTWL